MKNLRRGGFLIAKIHQLNGRILSKKLKDHEVEEINPAQGRLLFALWQNDNISIQELAERTSLGKSTLTSMLDRLEADGILQRVPCKDDRRKILIQLTHKDDHLKKLYTQVVMEMSGAFYAGFTESEIDQFEGYLERIFHNLTKYEG